MEQLAATLACLNGSARTIVFALLLLGECLMHFWFLVRGNRAAVEVGILQAAEQVVRDVVFDLSLCTRW